MSQDAGLALYYCKLGATLAGIVDFSYKDTVVFWRDEALDDRGPEIVGNTLSQMIRQLVHDSL